MTLSYYQSNPEVKLVHIHVPDYLEMFSPIQGVIIQVHLHGETNSNHKAGFIWREFCDTLLL